MKTKACLLAIAATFFAPAMRADLQSTLECDFEGWQSQYVIDSDAGNLDAKRQDQANLLLVIEDLDMLDIGQTPIDLPPEAPGCMSEPPPVPDRSETIWLLAGGLAWLAIVGRYVRIRRLLT